MAAGALCRAVQSGTQNSCHHGDERRKSRRRSLSRSAPHHRLGNEHRQNARSASARWRSSEKNSSPKNRSVYPQRKAICGAACCAISWAKNRRDAFGRHAPGENERRKVRVGNVAHSVCAGADACRDKRSIKSQSDVDHRRRSGPKGQSGSDRGHSGDALGRIQHQRPRRSAQRRVRSFPRRLRHAICPGRSRPAWCRSTPCARWNEAASSASCTMNFSPPAGAPIHCRTRAGSAGRWPKKSRRKVSTRSSSPRREAPALAAALRSRRNSKKPASRSCKSLPPCPSPKWSAPTGSYWEPASST